MTLRRRLARARLRYHALRHRHAVWVQSLTRLRRAGLMLAVGTASSAVLLPIVGPDVALWSGVGGALLNETLFVLFERPAAPRPV